MKNKVSIEKIIDCLMVSVLWVIGSVPLITIGASTAALMATCTKVIRYEESYVGKHFFKSFQACFVRSTLLWVLVCFIESFLFFEFRLAMNLSVDQRPWIAVAVFILLWMCLIFLIWLYALGLMTVGEKAEGIMLRAACSQLIIHAKGSFLIIMVLAIACLLCLHLPWLLVIVPGFLGCLISHIVIKKVDRQPIEKEGVDETEYYNSD